MYLPFNRLEKTIAADNDHSAFGTIFVNFCSKFLHHSARVGFRPSNLVFSKGPRRRFDDYFEIVP